MTPGQLQKLSTLYHAARDLEPGEREAFLCEHCWDDEKLLLEIQHLLSADEKVGDFLVVPVADIAAQIIADEKATSLVGRQLGHYRILSRLGAGGMGEVYLAEDSNLDRKIAIKVLPVEFASNLDRLRRFEREAKSASSTNHPNIITIHEIGESEGIHYIATEFVEGETLRQRIKLGPLPEIEALSIARQMANALAAAHALGIVHRDIKPENVMLRPDGFVKVLDFGLAAVEKVPLEITDSKSPTIPADTAPGTIMGTVTYMSPEQTRGQKADARSDLWSLGVVLYEMIAGEPPFQGASVPEVFVAILERQPLPLPTVSPELESIVLKLLAKDREQRCHSSKELAAKELAAELKALKRRLEFEQESGGQPAARPSASGSQAIGTETAIFSPQRVSQSDQPQTLPLPVPATSRARRFRFAVVGAAMLLASMLAAGGYWYFNRSNTIDSIAVMPLLNQSNDPNLEYLTDGVTENLIDNLSRLPGLKVLSRTSVFRYKGQAIDPEEVADKLKVKSLLTGRILQQEEKLLIKLELVDARDGRQIWSEQYFRSKADMLRLQTEVSQTIAAQLRPKLTGEEKARVTRRYTENPDAYDLYLKGISHWNKLTREGFEESIKYFKEALTKDSNFALAYAWLSVAHYTLGANHYPPKEWMPKAKDFALKARELDETLADAHVALAMVYYGYDWNWHDAERELQRALELNPNLDRAYNVYGYLLQALGRAEEPIPMKKQALELSPLSLIANLNMGRAYYLARHYDQAIAAYQEAIKLEPKHSSAHLYIGRIYALKGMHEKALASINTAQALAPGDKHALAFVGYADAVAGKRVEAQNVLEELGRLPILRHQTMLMISGIHAALGDSDNAFRWLDRIYQDRSPWIINIQIDPMFDSLHTDQRFKGLLKNTGQSL